MDPTEAILQTYRDKSFGLTIAEQNTLKRPVARVPYCELSVFDSGVIPLTLNEFDEQTMTLQVALNYPAGTGDTEILAKANEIITSYSFNDRISDVGFFAIVTNKSTFNGVVEKGWYRVLVRLVFLIYLNR